MMLQVMFSHFFEKISRTEGGHAIDINFREINLEKKNPECFN